MLSWISSWINWQSFATGGFVIGILQYCVIPKKDKMKQEFDDLKYFCDKSENVVKKFTDFKLLLEKYIDTIKNQSQNNIITVNTHNFIELTNVFEDLFKDISKICIFKMQNKMPDIVFNEYYGLIKEIGDEQIIQYYYKITKMKYNVELYRNLFIVYNRIIDNTYQLTDL